MVKSELLVLLNFKTNKYNKNKIVGFIDPDLFFKLIYAEFYAISYLLGGK